MKTISSSDMFEITNRVANVLQDILRREIPRLELDDQLRLFLNTFNYAKVEGESDEETAGEKVHKVWRPDSR